jgi:predicted DNA-binding transcriptional regulator AlpA
MTAPPAALALLPGQTLRDLLTKKEVAARLRRSVRKLEYMVAAGQFPTPGKDTPNSPCLWLRQAVEDWISRTYR